MKSIGIEKRTVKWNNKMTDIGIEKISDAKSDRLIHKRTEKGFDKGKHL